MIPPVQAWIGRGVRLLVVEDDDVVRHALEEMLKEADLGEYKFAAGGEEALDILADFRADIVLTEGNLQGMDSLDLLRRLRNKETSPNPGVLIVVMASRWPKPTACGACAASASRASSRNPFRRRWC